MKTENYTRVIPRDFFNEAKLLKCMGLLSLKILDANVPEEIKITMEDSGDPFEVHLSDEGSLFLTNYRTRINGVPVVFKTTYNSKSNYPFFCEYDYCDYAVFTEDGDFDDEFLQFATALK